MINDLSGDFVPIPNSRLDLSIAPVVRIFQDLTGVRFV